MSDLSPEVRKALWTYHVEALLCQSCIAGASCATHQKFEDALVAVIRASHPLVALWREWVEASKAHSEAVGADDLEPSAHDAYTRLLAAEDALLNYRSDT